MSVRIHVSGRAKKAVEDSLPSLIESFIASRIADKDSTIWGADAEAEASIRLGWVSSALDVAPLIDEITELRSHLHESGLTRIVLAGMGGSSLAPEVMANTAGAELVILDSTSPGQVRSALGDDLSSTVLVVSSKSGSTVETDSAKKIFEAAFNAAGIEPSTRIIVVTDPNSPLDKASRAAGYRVFNADPTVGGRFSAVTAFGLVPAGLAGVDISSIVSEAIAATLECSIDDPANPALVLGAAIAKSVSQDPKIGLITDGTHVQGFPDWVEQLVAESTGKHGKGILPVVLDVVSTEVGAHLPDLQIVRFVDDAHEHHLVAHDRHDGEILISGTLGALFVMWEFATSIAAYLIGVNPFDQPDVESAKVATRALLTGKPSSTKALFVDGGIEVRAHGDFAKNSTTAREAITSILETLSDAGYVSIQAYIDRANLPQTSGVRDLLAARAGRPVTFGWGPRFLHSTGQFHKGGYPTGVFIQIVQNEAADLAIPDSSFTCGELISAQAAGDAEVLASHGRPVLTLTLPAGESHLLALFEAFN